MEKKTITQGIQEFVSERCEHDEKTVVPLSTFYEEFLRWRTQPYFNEKKNSLYLAKNIKAFGRQFWKAVPGALRVRQRDGIAVAGLKFVDYNL